MPLTFDNRLQETCTGNGTADVTLQGAVPGFVSYSNSKIIANTLTPYILLDSPNFEIGVGEWDGGTGFIRGHNSDDGYLIRTTSSDSGDPVQPISLNPSKTQIIFCDLPAELFLFLNADGTLANPTAFRNTAVLTSVAALQLEAPEEFGEHVLLITGLTDPHVDGWYKWEADGGRGENIPGEGGYAIAEPIRYESTTAGTGQGLWVRKKLPAELTQTTDNDDAPTNALYTVGDELRRKRIDGAIKKIAEIENEVVDSYATLAALLAETITDVDGQPWADGQTVEIRGLSAEGDIDSPMRMTWDKDSTEENDLGINYFRPDDISGSNPGRFVFAQPEREIQFTDSDGTPDVSGGNEFKVADTPPALITTFDKMRIGQRITVKPGDVVQTFEHNSSTPTVKLLLPKELNFVLAPNDASIVFYKDTATSIRMEGAGAGISDALSNYAALKAVTPSAGLVRNVSGQRAGQFIYDASDLSSILVAQTISIGTGDINTGTDALTVTAHALDWVNGCCVTGGDGLTANTQLYYLGYVDGDTLALYTTYADAVADTNRVNITGTTAFDIKVLSDPQEGAYVIPSGANLTGTAGAWLRYTWAIGRTLSVTDFGMHPGNSAADNTRAWRAATWFFNYFDAGGRLEVPFFAGEYQINDPGFIYRPMTISGGGTIRNVRAVDSATENLDQYRTCCLFVGNMGGGADDHAFEHETSYDFTATTGPVKEITLDTAAEAANFSAGDIIVLEDANYWATGTTDPIAIWGGEVLSADAGTGVIRLSTWTKTPFTADGGTLPKIRKNTGTLIPDGTLGGWPTAPARMAQGVIIEGVKFVSDEKYFSSPIYASAYKCDFDIPLIDGGNCFVVNSVFETQLNLPDIRYYRRGVELAQYHYNIFANDIIIRREGDDATELGATTNWGLVIGESGNHVYINRLEAEDEPWSGSLSQSVVQFNTPHNYVKNLSVKGYQGTGRQVTIGVATTQRGANTHIEAAQLYGAYGTALYVDAEECSVGNLIVDGVRAASAAACVSVTSQANGTFRLDSARLGSGNGAGERYRIHDSAGISSDNHYGQIISDIHQPVRNDVAASTVAGTGSLNVIKTYTVNAATLHEYGGIEVFWEGRLPASATNGNKSIQLKFGATSSESIVGQVDLSSSEVGAITMRATILNRGALDDQDINLEIVAPDGSSGGVIKRYYDERTHNTEAADVTVQIAVNMNASDDLITKKFIVKGINDKFKVV